MKNYQINHYTLANGDTVIYDEIMRTCWSISRDEASPKTIDYVYNGMMNARRRIIDYFNEMFLNSRDYAYGPHIFLLGRKYAERMLRLANVLDVWTNERTTLRPVSTREIPPWYDESAEWLLDNLDATFEQYDITMKLRGTEHMYGKVEFEIVRGLFERLGREMTETYIKKPSSL